MSTDYEIGCKRCQKLSGFSFSWQAWGRGNSDPFATMRFLLYHATECGTENIIIVREQTYDWEEDTGEHLLDVFPCSPQWDKDFIEKQKWTRGIE